MDKNNAAQPLYTAQGKPAGRIRQKNEETILAAAAEEFARYGFKGTSMNAIASRAGLPKANVHYYFNSKLGLYVGSCGTSSNSGIPPSTTSPWTTTRPPPGRVHPHQDGILAAPSASLEDLRHGSHQRLRMPVRALQPGLSQLVPRPRRGIRHWIAAGKMDPVDPMHLIFLIWAGTQHYADFSDQIRRINGKRMTRADFALASDNLIAIILKGCGLKPPAAER